MFTVDQVINDVKKLNTKGQSSKSNPWSDRDVYMDILNYRSRIVRQKYENKVQLMQSNYQESPCLKLVERPRSECKIDFASDCKLYRTELIIPKSIIPYRSVYNPENTKEYTPVDLSKLKHRINTRFKSLNESTFYYLSDQGIGDYLYIVSDNPLLSKIIISAIWENPIEIQTYPDCEGNINFPCRSYYDYEFKIDQSLFITVKEMIIRNYAGIRLNAPLDLDNDNNPQ